MWTVSGTTPREKGDGGPEEARRFSLRLAGAEGAPAQSRSRPQRSRGGVDGLGRFHSTDVKGVGVFVYHTQKD